MNPCKKCQNCWVNYCGERKGKSVNQVRKMRGYELLDGSQMTKEDLKPVEAKEALNALLFEKKDIKIKRFDGSEEIIKYKTDFNSFKILREDIEKSIWYITEENKPIFDKEINPLHLSEYMKAADLLGLEYKIEKNNIGTGKAKVFTYKITIYKTE